MCSAELIRIIYLELSLCQALHGLDLSHSEHRFSGIQTLGELETKKVVAR